MRKVDENALLVELLDVVATKAGEALIAGARPARQRGRTDARACEVHERDARYAGELGSVEVVERFLEGVAALDTDQRGVLAFGARGCVFARALHDRDRRMRCERAVQAREVV